MSKSEVARFRQEQAMEEQGAQQGLHGFALVASHKIITARLEQAKPYLVQLLQAGKVEECDQAIDAITRELSTLEEGDGSVCHTMAIEGNNRR